MYGTISTIRIYRTDSTRSTTTVYDSRDPVPLRVFRVLIRVPVIAWQSDVNHSGIRGGVPIRDGLSEPCSGCKSCLQVACRPVTITHFTDQLVAGATHTACDLDKPELWNQSRSRVWFNSHTGCCLQQNTRQRRSTPVWQATSLAEMRLLL